MRTAVDLINLTPPVALDGDVPQQVWTGKKVSYKHLRVFGCRASVPQVDDDVTTDDTGSQLQLEPAGNLPRRSDRVRRHSTRYPPHEYVLLTDGGEPKCCDEAVAHEHKEHWLKVMNEEMNSLYENHTYDLVKLPQASLNLEIEQLDVKTAFMHGDLEEEIYMKQPEGFQVKSKEHL
ncbi:hypothetical protein CRG98_022492, partial [Punica granatum]